MRRQRQRYGDSPSGPQGALAEMRAPIFELRPPALAEEGLVSALTPQAATLTAREGIPINVSGPEARPAWDPAVEEHLYRLTLEALNNAVTYAEAARIDVAAICADDRLTVTVADDGVGFDTARPNPGHIGQSTMAERATAIGATISVVSARGAARSPSRCRPGELSWCVCDRATERA